MKIKEKRNYSSSMNQYRCWRSVPQILQSFRDVRDGIVNVAAGANGKHVFDASSSKCGTALATVQEGSVRRVILQGDVRDHVPRPGMMLFKYGGDEDTVKTVVLGQCKGASVQGSGNSPSANS